MVTLSIRKLARWTHVWPWLLALLSAAAPLSAGAADLARATDPVAGFAQPPDEVRPHVLWHWMNGNVSKEGITLDLEAMQRVGIRGAHIYNAAPSIPSGPVRFMTPEWREMTRYALQEAERLGIEIGFHNCAGWSSSGGPWVPVEQSMMELTWSETRIEGGKRFEGMLAQPFTRKGYYRDEVLLAVPTPANEVVSMRDLSPVVTTSIGGQSGAVIVDGDPMTLITGPTPSKDKPQTITIALERPLAVQTLSITPGSSFGAHGGTLECSDDGTKFRAVCPFQIPEMGNAQSYLTQGFDPVTAQYFRLVFNKSDSRQTPLTIAEVDLSARFQLNDWRAKAGFINKPDVPMDSRAVAPGGALRVQDVVDLTGQIAQDGRLKWEAPAGRWTLLRFGYTTKDKFNKPATPEAVGYECDKMSKAALETFWSGMMKTVLTDNRDLVGKSLRYVMLDSFEVGAQNYTAGLPGKFRERFGYSMLPYMPALTGTVVESIDVTERFLWDYRRLVAEMWKENYFDHLNTLAGRSGITFIGQNYGNGNFDAVSSGTGIAIPMTEFWVNKPRNSLRHAVVVSAAHLSGRSTIFAESFTAHPQDGAWKNSPGSVKAIGDLAFCDGVNGIAFHTYAHQPWVDARPGMTMGPYGIHFNRGNTWWEYIGPWMDYLARCQLLLRRGRTVVDVAIFAGENAPVSGGSLPRLDGFHSEFVDCAGLEKMSVKDGVLVLPDGMAYRVLMVRPEPRGLSLPVLREIRRLVRAGATLVAPKTVRTPSLQGFPQSEEEERTIAADIWGESPTDKSPRKVVLGRVIGTVLTAEILRRDVGLAEDCMAAGTIARDAMAYIHRVEGETHYYFVSNQTGAPFAHELRFRVSGAEPELWDPLTGKRESVGNVRSDATTTTVPISLPAAGATFVVFRPRGAAPAPLATRVAWNGAASGEARDILLEQPWQVTFAEPGVAPRTMTFEKLLSWSDREDTEVRYFSGTATYETDFTLPDNYRAQQGLHARLDLGRVEVIAEVKVNAHAVPVLWTQPFQADVTELLRPGRNHLKVRVANLWPNRLIGDQQLGDTRKWSASGAAQQWPGELIATEWPAYSVGLHWMTWRHYSKNDPLLASGLLGPVRIEFGREGSVASP